MLDGTRQPYPGLRSFERDDSDLFFGREDCIEAMIDRLEAKRFLAVLGSSGTGKSSLVKAGLLPALETGKFVAAGRRWKIAQFRPGGDPFEKLAGALLPADHGPPSLAGPTGASAEWAARFRRGGPRELIKWCSEGHLPAGTNLFLLVDQFEEIFRYSNSAERETAQAFISLLLESSWPLGTTAPSKAPLPIYVAITMRSEYLGASALMLGLAEAINAGTFLTPRMTRDQCERAIVGPALLCDVDIEDRLVTRLLNDMADFAPWEGQREAKDEMSRLARQADQLPLMQYALNQMWLRAKETVSANQQQDSDASIQLKLEDYLGFQEELNKRGEDVYHSLSNALRETAETIFRAVTSGSTPANAERRPTTYGELVALCGPDSGDAVAAVIGKFGADDCQFLTVNGTPTDHWIRDDISRIDISHEALIRQWRQLSEWLLAEGVTVRTWRRFNEQAEQYVGSHPTLGRRLIGLWNGIGLLSGWELSAWRENTAKRFSRRSAGLAALVSRVMGARELNFISRVFVRGRTPIASWAQRYAIDLNKTKTLLHWSSVRRTLIRDLVIIFALIPLALLVYVENQWSNAKSFASRSATDANSLVFDIGQDPHMDKMPREIRTKVFDVAISGFTLALRIDPSLEIAYVGRAAAYDDEGKYDLAIADDTSAIALDPKDAIAYYNRGNAYRDNKQSDLAIADYTQAIKLNPTYEDAYVNRGVAYDDTGKYDLAIADYTQAIKLNPKDPFAWNDRGNAYDDEGKYDLAIADYNQAIALDPNYVVAYYDRGNAYDDKGEYDLAIADYTKAITLNPNYATAYNGRGVAYKDKGEYNRAIADYTEAIRLNPQYALAYNNRGYAYKQLGKYDEAISDYTAAIKIDPKYANAYINRGIVYDDTGRYDLAIADYTEAIKLKPKDAIAYNNRGNAYDDKGEYDLAIADYNQAIAISPNYAIAYNGRGVAYKDKGDIDRAIADYTQAIKLDPKYALAYDNRGSAYLQMGDLTDALADFTAAIKIDPKYAIAYDNRGSTYLQMGDLTTALADFTAAIKIDPKYALAYDNRANVYLAQGNYTAAVTDYDQSLATRPNVTWPHVGRAVANLLLGSLDVARSDLEQARKLAPQYAYSALWLEIVDKRSHVPSELAQAVAHIDMTKWPAPLIQFYLGQLTAEKAAAAAANADARINKGQTCEANFYIGEWRLQQGDKSEADRLFRLATANCPKNFLEWAVARGELKALGNPVQ